MLRASNSQSHEIDVLAEKRDVAGVHRVAVECKAWKSSVEKDVVYKLHQEMTDLGLTKGIIVSVSGLKSGARAAADQRHIELWGADEVRHYLGEEALSGLPLAAPDEALGIEVTIGREDAEREIKKARSGFAGIGAEEIASIDLLWVPAFELQLAVTRVRPGLVKDRDEVIRRWNLFEGLTGRLVGQRDDPRSFVTVGLSRSAVRAQKASPQIVGEMRRTLPPPLLDIKGLAALLCVDPRHVQRLVTEKRIPYIKWGHYIRFDRAAIRRWLDKHRRGVERAERPSISSRDFVASSGMDVGDRRTGDG